MTLSSSRLIFLLSSLWMLTTRCVAQSQPPLVDCDPCIKRSEYTLQAILHGTSSEVFWLEMQASMRQTALDMGVSLTIELPEVFNAQVMAQQIKNAAASNDIDALIVTIPNEIVQKAVAQVIADGMPVFGVNVGYEVAQELGILGHAAQDDYLAGQRAGEEFLKNANVTSAVFISMDPTSQIMPARQSGFADYVFDQAGIVVDTLIVDPENIFEHTSLIEAVFENCPYHAVLLGGYESVSMAATAFERHKCQQITQVGAMEGNQEISDAIVQNSLVFGITQQSYIQAAFPVLLAALYVTTDKKVALPLEEKVYLSGPVIWTKANLPSDSLQTCELDAFPICPNTNGIVEGVKAKCACVDRPTIRIGGVLHGVTTDSFWDPVFAASRQAALDMGIALDLERFLPQETNDLVYEQMAARIRNLCESGVDGIYVTIPTDAVIESIQRCQQLNVPVISINSGRDVSRELGLIHHVGMIEYNAGVGAGERMIAAGMKRGFCLDHAFGNTATADRCRGFGDTIAASGDDTIIYEGHFDVPPDNRAQYKVLVEGFVDDDGGDWAGIGLMAIGPQQLPATREVVTDHPAAIVGTFDVGPTVTEGLADGLLVFGVDQGPFFQGNLPVYLLTYLAYTRQHLINFDIESGPTFVMEPPSDAEKICEANFYEVCPDRPAEDFNYISNGFLGLGYALFAVLALASIFAASWTWYHREKWVVKVSQPHLLGMVILGCFMSSLSIMFMGVQTGYRQDQDSATGEPTDRENTDISRVDASCMTWPWLYGLGFVITFSSLFAKIQRVKLIYLAGLQMRRKTIEFKDVAYIVAFMFVIETAILLSWQIASPLRWEREVRTEEDGFPVESVGSCTSDDGWHYFLALVLFHVACLFCALVLCFQTKDINSDFAESSYISLAVIFMFQVLVLAVPISALVQDNTDVFYFVRACAIFLQNFTVLVLLFVPKMFRVSEVQSEDAQGTGRSSTRYSLAVSRPSHRISGMDSGIISNDGDSSLHFSAQNAASAAAIVRNSLIGVELNRDSENSAKKQVRFGSEGGDTSGPERSTTAVTTSASFESNEGKQANHEIQKEEVTSKKSIPPVNPPLDEEDWTAQPFQESQGVEPATVPSTANEDPIQIQEPIPSPKVQEAANPDGDAALQNHQPPSREPGEAASTDDDPNIAAPEDPAAYMDPTMPLEMSAQLLAVASESQSSIPKMVSLAGQMSDDNSTLNETHLAASTPSDTGLDVWGDLLDGSLSSDVGYETMYLPSELASDWESLGFQSKEHALAALALVSLDTTPEQRKALLASGLIWMKKNNNY
jgi:simple sugar transport system substrate-binding protein